MAEDLGKTHILGQEDATPEKEAVAAAWEETNSNGHRGQAAVRCLKADRK